MKIVHVTSCHSPFDTRIFFKQAVSLSKEGHEVDLIVTSNDYRSQFVDNVHINVQNKITNRIAGLFINGYRVFKKAYYTRADVFHFHDPELIPWFLLLKLFGKKVVMDVHENYPAHILGRKWIGKPLRYICSYIVLILEHIAVKVFDGVVTADDALQKRFQKIAWNTPIITANNYPIITPGLSSQKITKAKYEANILLFLGGITQARCAREFISALGKMDTIEYKVILGGNENNQEMLASLKTFKGWDHVYYVGRVPVNRIESLLLNASISINLYSNLPNHKGNRSNRLFEAMAAGLPVIVSKHTEAQSFVEKHQCGIAVDPSNPIEISKAVMTLLTDHELAMWLGINGKNLVLKKYNWTSESYKIINMYHGCQVKVGRP